MAAAAPAFAASPCDPVVYTMAWNDSAPGAVNFTRAANGRSATGTAVVTGSASVVVSMASTSYSNGAVNNAATSDNYPDPTRNLSVPPRTAGSDANLDPAVTSLGGRANERGVRLQHARSLSNNGRATRQEVVVSFSRPVQGLQFFITDIDRIDSPIYQDRVELTSSPALPAANPRTQALDGVTGTGVIGDPWLRNANQNVGENARGAQVQVTYPANVAINSVTISYWNAAGGTQYHRIYVGNMTFTAAGCA